MAIIAAFQLATPPAQPQAVGIVIPGGQTGTAFRFWSNVVATTGSSAPPDPGASYAY
jgi:hypothetical protein